MKNTDLRSDKFKVHLENLIGGGMTQTPAPSMSQVLDITTETPDHQPAMHIIGDAGAASGLRFLLAVVRPHLWREKVWVVSLGTNHAEMHEHEGDAETAVAAAMTLLDEYVAQRWPAAVERFTQKSQLQEAARAVLSTHN